jgi:hypothetical protein
MEVLKKMGQETRKKHKYSIIILQFHTQKESSLPKNINVFNEDRSLSAFLSITTERTQGKRCK